MREVWKKTDLYGKKYYISNKGRLKNRFGRILKPYLSSGGYEYIKLVKDGRHHHIRIHRIVAQAFIPNPDNLPQINHKDGNKVNNCVDNLEWCTCSSNISHGFKNNLFNRKGKSRETKIDQYDVNGKFIKRWSRIKDIEEEYNVSHTAIRFCCLDKIKTCAGYVWRYADGG